MKQGLDEIKQVGNLLCDHHQYHHKSRQCCHRRLFITAAAGQNLIQYGNDDANRRDFKDQINIHRSKKQYRQRHTGADPNCSICAYLAVTIRQAPVQLRFA